MSPRGEGAIAFAEKVLALLELGAFSATYKYALLWALLDLCLSLAVARAMYSRPPDGARLWVAGDEFVAVDREGLRAAFGP